MRRPRPSPASSAPTGEAGAALAYAFARQLRSDVDRSFRLPGVEADEAFLIWWVVHGRREYRCWQALSVDQQQRLFDPLPDVPTRGGFGMNPLLCGLMRLRPDLRATFNTQDPVGYWDAVAWLHVHGLGEYGLDGTLSPAIRARLLSPCLDVPGGSPSWASYFAWRLRPNLQAAFDFGSLKGRQDFACWLADGGAPKLGLPPSLLSPTAPQQPAAPRKMARPFGVNLIGYAFGELGIGEDVRMAAAACSAAGIPWRLVNIDPGSAVRAADRHLEAAAASAGPDYFANLFCLTGFETARLFLEQGSELFAGHHNIGWWPWELPVWPAAWANAFDVVDEVWAATRFTAEMYGRATRKPVHHVPLPVSVDRAQAVDRRKLGLPPKRFLFLFIFDFNSYVARKNPWAALEAFGQAFPRRDRGVGLVFKTMNASPDDADWQAFRAACAGDDRVVVIEETLARPEVLGLIDACDAYVSLHRSEGFGRTIAEALLFAKSVVATDFSGSTDLLTTDLGYPVEWQPRAVGDGDYAFVAAGDSAVWADADIAHAAAQLRRARTEGVPHGGAHLAAFAQRFAPATIGEQISARLTAAWRCQRSQG